MKFLFRDNPIRLAFGAIVASGILCTLVREYYIFQLPHRYYIWCWWPLIGAWDIALTLVLLCLFGVALLLIGNRPTLRRILAWLTIAFCWILSIINTLAMPTIFEYRAAPTLGLIRFIGVADFFKLAPLFHILITATAFPLLTWLLARFWEWIPSRLARRIIGASLVLLSSIVVVLGWSKLGYLQENVGLSANFTLSMVSSLSPARLSDHPPTVAFPPTSRDYFEVRPAQPKNLILLTLESVEAKFLSLYGGVYPTTPNLEKLSDRSLVFENFYAPTTNSSNSLHAMLLGSDYSGIWKDFTLSGWNPPAPTLAEHLKKAGYRTSFVTSCNFTYANLNLFVQSRGFDHYIDYESEKIESNAIWGVDDHYLVDFILKSVDSTPAGAPFFVMAWNQGTHWSFTPAPEHQEIDFLKGDRKFGASTYDFNNYLNALHFIDQQIQRLMEELEKRGLAEDTLIALVGDHGEAFGWPHETWGHSAHVFEEDVHVPFVLISKNAFSPGHRVPTPASMFDLSPTILDLMNITPPSQWVGKSVLKSGHPATANFHGANNSLQFGVRRDQWKYIYNPSLQTESLYDLNADPDEQHDVSQNHPDLCASLRKLILDQRQK